MRRLWQLVLPVVIVLASCALFLVNDSSVAGASTTTSATCAFSVDNVTGTYTGSSYSAAGSYFGWQLDCSNMGTADELGQFTVRSGGLSYWLYLYPTTGPGTWPASFTCAAPDGATSPTGPCAYGYGVGYSEVLVANSYCSAMQPACGLQAGWTSGHFDFNWGTVTLGSAFGPAPCQSAVMGGLTYSASDGVTQYPFTVAIEGTWSEEVLLDTSASPGLPFTTIDGKAFGSAQVLATGVPGVAGPYGLVNQLNLTPVSGDPVNPELWCDSAGTWYDMGSASTLNPSLGGAACTLVGATEKYAVSDGTTNYPLVVSWTGIADRVEAVDDSVTSGTTVTIDGKSFFSAGLNLDYVVTSGDQSLSESVTPVAPDAVDSHLWCYTGSSWVDWGMATSDPYSGVITPPVVVQPVGTGSTQCSTDGGAFCLYTCITGAGMSLYNPVSWVTGAFYWITCGVRWVFQPSRETWQGLTNQFGLGGAAVCSSGAKASITQLFGCMAGGVVVAPAADVAAIKSAASSGSCSATTGGTSALVIAGQSVTACSLVADTGNSDFSSGASGSLSDIEVVETAAVYIFAALALIFFIRGTLRGRDDN